MSLAKTGEISNCCQPNALLTLKEYLVDYASDDTRKKGEDVIAKELDKIPNPQVRSTCQAYLDKIIHGGKRFPLLIFCNKYYIIISYFRCLCVKFVKFSAFHSSFIFLIV